MPIPRPGHLALLAAALVATTFLLRDPVFDFVQTPITMLQNLGSRIAVNCATTALASIGCILVFFVYAKLISSNSYLSSTSLYVKKPLQSNVGRLLSACWPDKSSDPAIDNAISINNDAPGPSSTDFRLLYVGRMRSDGTGDRVARGVEDCVAQREEAPVDSPLWIANGSQLNSHMIQILVWEWITAWLVLIMMLETMLFNGVFTNETTIDTVPRLVIVGMYLIAFCVHFWFIWRLGTRFYTEVAAGSTWSLLERSRFAVASYPRLRARAASECLLLRGISKTNVGLKIPFYQVRFSHEMKLLNDALPAITTSRPAATTRTDDAADENNALKVIEKQESAERERAEIAIKLATDRTTYNALVMLGVAISTGFTAWTSSQFTEDSPNNLTTHQIGSMALLASMAIGVGSMLSSAMNLRTLTYCFHQLVSLVEVKINGQAIAHHKKKRATAPLLGFTYDTIAMSPVSMMDMFYAAAKSGKLFQSILFGPAYVMIPTRADHERVSSLADYELNVDVRGHHVLLTTLRTDSHLVIDGSNAEAVNVCFLGAQTYRGSGEKRAEVFARTL
jgi:hypothetical protein